jgi:hypothetical protein
MRKEEGKFYEVPTDYGTQMVPASRGRPEGASEDNPKEPVTQWPQATTQDDDS